MAKKAKLKKGKKLEATKPLTSRRDPAGGLTTGQRL
jgi:hypothetical protein